ncbi:MAG: response regulator, partial [Chloroflexi bacterium]|nr:response regulator [Chloroflexota bacterium]
MTMPAGLPEQLDFHHYTILIVDDNPTNLGVVFDYLEQYGFTLLVAQSGESGLQKAEYARPDIILLDVMMPDLDGFETCRRLKSNDKTSDIPVIFMTALGDIESKLKGFEVGAVDYVTKPLHQAELLARIATHLRLRQLTHDLQQANDELQKLNANKDKFFSIVAHDLRGPFAPLLMRAQMLARQSGKLSQEKMA